MDSLEGRLLCASSQLTDPNFARAVVLMIQHNDQGALGVVLNRPTSKTLSELWREVGESPCEVDLPVHLGGPVSGPLMALHTHEACGEIEILPNLFFAAKKANLDQVVVLPECQLKVFVGHAGWAPGQLEAEIEQGAWRALPATTECVFYQGDDLWESLTKRAGASALQSMLKIKHVPDDISRN